LEKQNASSPVPFSQLAAAPRRTITRKWKAKERDNFVSGFNHFEFHHIKAVHNHKVIVGLINFII